MLSPEVELVAIQPPGRSSRINEPAYNDMQLLVSHLMESITPLLNVPFVFFGHSLGSRIAYALAIRLKAHHLPLPIQFFASGSGAPHIAWKQEPVYNLPDDEFISELQRLDGTPEDVLQNREIMELFLPVLRADFQIADTYVSDKVVLNCPITILAGTEDFGIEAVHLEGWRELTQHPSEVQYIPGDHFFIEKNKQLVFDSLCRNIELCLHRKAPQLLVYPVSC